MFWKKDYKALAFPAGSFRFLGEPRGEVETLQRVLREGLRHDLRLKHAYLSLIRYANEERMRVALCIETESSPQDVIGALSKHCAQFISSIDIMFFSDLSQHHVEELKCAVKPFCGQPESSRAS